MYPPDGSRGRQIRTSLVHPAIFSQTCGFPRSQKARIKGSGGREAGCFGRVALGVKEVRGGRGGGWMVNSGTVDSASGVERVHEAEEVEEVEAPTAITVAALGPHVELADEAEIVEQVEGA